MNYSRTYITGILLLTAMLFTQCSVQKRVYRQGYYLSFKKAPLKVQSPGQKRELAFKATKQINTVQGTDQKQYAKQERGLTVSAQTGGHKMQPLSIRSLPVINDSCGDKIVFRDGEEIAAKVYEIGNDYVKYKFCDNLEGPLRVSSKNKVFMIKYASGTKEVFTEKVEKEEPGTNDNLPAYRPVQSAQTQKLHGGAITGFILSLFSWTIILAPVAFLVSAFSLNHINEHPEKYYGKGFATAGLIISLIAMLIILIAIATF
jgi:hypothetical protein